MTLLVPQDDTEQTVTTPTVGRAIRRAAVWVVAVLATVVIAIFIVSAATGGLNQGADFAPENPGPNGAMAVAEVLKAHGVDVKVTTTIRDTVDAAGDDSMILLVDSSGYLDDGQRAQLLRATDDLVVVEPGFFELSDLAPGVEQAGFGSAATFTVDCDLPAAQKAEKVTTEGPMYRIITGDATGCFADGDTYGLVQLTHDDDTITLLGLADALRNDQVATDGNAALALNLLGTHRTLVWYNTSSDDLSGQPATIADLTPPWVTPLSVMLIIVAVGAIFWRARRVGPLVVENLPVVVRASETMQGRARLYERGHARLHALDALRIGAVSRLARTCGLSRQATVDEVVDAVAAATGRDRNAVAGILISRIPENDAELVKLSDELLTLEADTVAGTRP